MSTERYSGDGLSINTFAGPWESTNSKSRTHVQITTSRGYVQLDMDQWIDLVCFIRRMDRAGEGITSYAEEPRE